MKKENEVIYSAKTTDKLPAHTQNKMTIDESIINWSNRNISPTNASYE